MPTYDVSDYVKIELPKTTGIGEWVWMRVGRCDDKK
jgi:hypothetical protein